MSGGQLTGARHAHLNPPLAADLYGDLLDTAPPPASMGWRDYAPGLAITIVPALAAAWLSEHYGAPLMLMGLLIGLVFNFVNGDRRLHPGLGLASKTLLRWGIVLAGAQITLSQIMGLGGAGFGWIAAMVALVTLSGALTARWLGLGAAFGTLAGGAVAICGASAALALASVLGERRASQAQLTLVLVAISAASAFAMSVYPALADVLGLSGAQAGFFLGASIHDVAQALGAGYSVSDAAGETATIVKLTRVALLAPALALVSLIFLSEGDRAVKASTAPAVAPVATRSPVSQIAAAIKRVDVPWFVLGFLGVVLINSVLPVPPDVTILAKRATSVLLLLAVVATGIRSPMQLLMQQGWRSTLPVIVATAVALLLGLLGAGLAE